MATYTDNYHLSKPEITDSQQSFMEDYATNMEIIDENMGGGTTNDNIANEYDNTQTYAVGDYVIYEGDLYKCTTAVTTAEDFDPTKWTQTIVTDELGGGGSGGHTIIDENDTEVAQEPNMQFTGKVEVTDDSTNEKTVVEVLPEVVEVTLAEYIALGDAVNTDGKLYCITDLNNSDVQGYPPLIYSTDEREVGVWIDGKPLYQRTWEFNSNFNIPYFAWIDTPILKGDMEYIISAEFANVINNVWSDVSTALTSSQYVQALNSLNATIVVRQITLRYTKTTDVAGSGTWNGQGGIAHHYSTSEKVIGTWIDGKPLYERTFSISEVTVSANSWYEITSISTANIKQLVSNKCLLTRNGMEWGLLSTQKSNNNYLNAFNPRNGNISFDTIVLQYTKTTD